MAPKIRYPARIAYPPEMKIKELRVTKGVPGVGFTDDLIPASGKRISVGSARASMFVVITPTTTSSRATLAFGEDHTGTPSKILMSYRQEDQYDDAGASMCRIHVVGDVDEKVRLTNVTYGGVGDRIITRVTVYYMEI